MALDTEGRLDVFQTVKEAISLVWALRTHYIVIALLAITPWTTIASFGFFGFGGEQPAPGAWTGEEITAAALPTRMMLALWGTSFLMMVIFAILWHRHVLLGPRPVLDLDVATLRQVFLRSFGYALSALAIGLSAFVISVFLAALVGTLIGTLFSALGGWLGYVAALGLMLISYIFPLAVLARFTLVFPALSIGDADDLGAIWSRAKDSSWCLVKALVIASIPCVLLAYALHAGILYGLFGIDVLDPGYATAAFDYWWITLLLGPLFLLPVAFWFAIVAISFRDLTVPVPVPNFARRRIVTRDTPDGATSCG